MGVLTSRFRSSTRAHACARACVHVCIYIHTYIHISHIHISYVYIYIYIYVYIHVRIHTYTIYNIISFCGPGLRPHRTRYQHLRAHRQSLPQGQCQCRSPLFQVPVRLLRQDNRSRSSTNIAAHMPHGTDEQASRTKTKP